MKLRDVDGIRPRCFLKIIGTKTCWKDVRCQGVDCRYYVPDLAVREQGTVELTGSGAVQTAGQTRKSAER